MQNRARVCPKCGTPNLCGIGKTGQSCWCTNYIISKENRIKIENEFGNDRCLCKNCLKEYAD